MQHDPGYEHWEERVPALERMMDRHSLKIEALEQRIVLLFDAVHDLIKILKEIETEKEDKQDAS